MIKNNKNIIYSNNLTIVADGQYSHISERSISYDCMRKNENGFVESVSTNCSRCATDSYLIKIKNTKDGILCRYWEIRYPEFNPCVEEQPEPVEQSAQFLWIKYEGNDFLRISEGRVIATEIEDSVANEVETDFENRPILEDDE